MNYRIAICEDGIYYKEELLAFLKAYESESGNSLLIESYSSGEEFLDLGKNKVYHIIILDVEMGKLTGVEVAREIRKQDETVPIIFATSHERYAIDAFDVSALGYLVKPVSYLKLKK